MIQLPVGFDYAGLFTDFLHYAAPFCGVAVLFVSYRIISRIARSI